MQKIINLTPHTVTLRTDTGDHHYPASGQVARVAVEMTPAGVIAEVPCSTRRCGQVTGFPAEIEPDTYYIVSTMVADALASYTGPEIMGRVLVPDSGSDAIRTSGPSEAARAALAALAENAEYAKRGFDCDPQLGNHVAILAAELARMPGQVEAVRRFIRFNN